MKSEQIKEYLWWFLLHNDRAVEKVILELYHQQTNDEKSNHITCHRNNKGFSTAHAKMGSFLAQKIMVDKKLSGIQLDQARRIAMHYVKQTSELLHTIDLGLPPSILKDIKRDSLAA